MIFRITKKHIADMMKGRGFFGAVGQIGSLTAISRLMGFTRDILIAGFIGAGPLADAFFVAFKLPNLFRRMTAEGALTNAFMPVYAKARRTGDDEAREFTAEIQASLFWGLMLLVVVFEIFMPVIMHLIAPGFGEGEGGDSRYEQAVFFARLTMPYLPMISLVALWAAITNAHDKFFGGAAAPIVLNLCLMTGALASGVFAAAGAIPLVVAIPVAGIFQMLLMQRMLGKIGRAPRLMITPRLGAKAKKMWRVFMPAALGAGGMQINLLVDLILASLLPVGAISALYYADRVAQLPLGIIGIALGTALLPRLAKLEASDKRDVAASTLARAIRLGAFFGIPAMLGAVILSHEIIGGLFAHGAFSRDNIAPVAAVLVGYGLGIPAFIFAKILLPAFYAAGDARSPMYISFATITLNIILSLVLMRLLGAVGLALATTLASWASVAVMAVLLARRGFITEKLLPTLMPTVILSLAMAAVLIGFDAILAGVSPAVMRADDILELSLLVAAGLVVYLGGATLFDYWPHDVADDEGIAGA